jgi:hypothetical protein
MINFDKEEIISAEDEQRNNYAELWNEIGEWLMEISVDDRDSVTLLDSVDEYLNKFREEFHITTYTTIQEAEATFLAKLEQWLRGIWEESLDAIGHARDIVDAYKAGEELDLDFSSCETDEELLYRAEEKWAEADDTYEEAEKLLEELASLKKVKTEEIETG